MKRKRIRKASAILTADIELRKEAPICRTDKDYFATFNKKLIWLRQLQIKHNCPIFDGGDLFDKKYKVHPSHELLIWGMIMLPKPFYTVPGNHDLPGKSIKNYDNSAMAVLESAGIIQVGGRLYHNDFVIDCYPWGVNIEQCKLGYESNIGMLGEKKYKIALVHAMVYSRHKPFPGCEGLEKKKLMRMLDEYDLIVSGHNHQTFVGKRGNTVLVNPGSLMRNDADQIDHKPCVFLWYAETNEVEQIFIPIEDGVISREHLDIKTEKEKRLDAFVEKLGEQSTTEIDFEKNLEINTNKVNQKISDKVWNYYER